MDLVNYIGSKVKVQLSNGYYYIGIVKNADETSLDLIDFKGHNVSVSKETITTIQEVSNGY